jgi:hypothetical protein
MKLFIYIPTYNRPIALRKLLDSLVLQSKDYKSNLRILINDNNSDNYVNDNILNEYNSNILFFRKNTCNIGGNANMNLGFIFAQPDEFLWILGDDDYLEPYALKYIFSSDKTNSDLILFTNEDSNHNTLYDIRKSYSEWMSFWVSSNIFKIDSFKNYVYSTFYYHNTSYPHIAIQWEAQKNNKLSVTTLPLKNILNRTVSDENNTAENYSLAWTGALVLSELLNKNDAEEFVKYWLKNYGINYFKNESQLKNSFDISRLVIFKLSYRIRYLYYTTKLRFILYDVSSKVYYGISLKNRNMIKNSSLYKKLVKFIKNENSITK